MSIKAIANVSLGVVGDGTSDHVTVNFGTAPFVVSGLGQPSGTTPEISKLFTLSQILPTGIYDVVSTAAGNPVAASIGILGAVTFTWDNPLTSGEEVTVYAKVKF